MRRSKDNENMTIKHQIVDFRIWKHGGFWQQLDLAQFKLRNVSPQPQSTRRCKDPSGSPETATYSTHFLRFLTLSFSDISGSVCSGCAIVSHQKFSSRCCKRSQVSYRNTPQVLGRPVPPTRALAGWAILGKSWLRTPVFKECPGGWRFRTQLYWIFF